MQLLTKYPKASLYTGMEKHIDKNTEIITLRYVGYDLTNLTLSPVLPKEIKSC